MGPQAQVAVAEDGVKIQDFILSPAQALKDKEGMCLFIGENKTGAIGACGEQDPCTTMAT